MITYTEKGAHLHTLVQDSGHFVKQVDGVWVSDDDVAVQAIIDAYNQLPDYKKDARQIVKDTALGKIQTLFPALSDIDTVNLVAELWLSVKAQAKDATPDLQVVIDIYTTAKSGIQSVNAAIDVAGVDAAVAGIIWPI